MPVLMRRTADRPTSAATGDAAAQSGLLSACANPGCSSGWLHLWRSRTGPIFEGGWSCSAACIAERLAAAVRREFAAPFGVPVSHRHRVPLGLLMLQQGWIAVEQLKEALRLQQQNGFGRVGQWLIAQQGVSEDLVVRALGLQWSCPVLPLDGHDPEGLAPVLPRLFIDAYGALPLRLSAGRLLYLGFEDRLDRVLCLAVERMSGMRVEWGMVQESKFRPAHERMLRSTFPAVQLIEAVSEPVLVQRLTRVLERARPAESRLVRVHDCLWLRMWRNAPRSAVPAAAEVEDIVCTIAPQ